MKFQRLMYVSLVLTATSLDTCFWGRYNHNAGYSLRGGFCPIIVSIITGKTTNKNSVSARICPVTA